MGGNPLTMRDHDAAAEVIRRRRTEGVRRAAKGVPAEAWVRAFEAVIMYYEREKDVDMADLLRIDLDRFARRTTEGAQVEWAKKKDMAG